MALPRDASIDALSSLADVERAVADARSAGDVLRVVGSGHSVVSAIYDPADPSETSRRGRPFHSVPSAVGTRLVTLDAMRSVHVDVAARRVAADAGARIGGDPFAVGLAAPRSEGICAALEREGLALPEVGGVSSQTIAGFLATGSAGGSTRYSTSAAIDRVDLVDGLGRRRSLCRDRDGDLVETAASSLGLLGVVTSVSINACQLYDLSGDEVVCGESEWDVDLAADGARGLEGFLRRNDHARVFWFPQPGVRKISAWRARRIPPCTDTSALKPYEPFARVAGLESPLQAVAGRALQWLGRKVWSPDGAVRSLGGLDGALHALVYRKLLRNERRTFLDRGWRTMAMDDAIDENLLPMEFTEVWLPLERAGEVTRRLRRFFDSHGIGAVGTFAVELYAAPAARSWLSPGFGRDSVRVNVIWFRGNPAAARTPVFERFWSLFEDLDPRMHWGKHMYADPSRVAAMARRLPRWSEFAALRREFDPDDVFVSSYWRERLPLDWPGATHTASTATRATTAPSEDRRSFGRAPTIHRWPLWYRLRPSSLAFASTAPFRFDNRAVVRASPVEAYDAFVEMSRGVAWADDLWSFEFPFRTPSGVGNIMDETYAFMSVRTRAVAAERGRKFAAVIEACSIPVASEMLQVVEFSPTNDGRTDFRWVIHYEPSAPIRRLHGAVRPFFASMFAASARNFAAMFERRGTTAPAADSVLRDAGASPETHALLPGTNGLPSP